MFINAKAAARYVGFEPGDGPARYDPAMKAFYAWLRVARVPKHYRGQRVLVFRVAELEAAILCNDDVPSKSASLNQMEALAREHVKSATHRKRA